MKASDPRSNLYLRKQIADGDGRFTFKNVPSGEYYVTTKIVWEAPVGFRGALIHQGGFVSKKIAVKESEELEVIVTKQSNFRRIGT